MRPLTRDNCFSLYTLCTSDPKGAEDRIAIEYGDDNLTYGELESYALYFASFLCSKGVSPGDRVLLLMENCLEYVICLFGVFAAGATAIPANPNSNAKEINFIATHSGAKTLISKTDILKRMGLEPESFFLKIIFQKSLENNCANFFNFKCATEISVHVAKEAPAMILYTSGTTGNPKGVVLSHDNLLANTFSIVKYLRLTPDDSIVNLLPFFYSFGNSVLLSHMAAGGRVTIENRFSLFPQAAVQTMLEKRPTGISGVPSTFYFFLSKTNFTENDWSFVRYVSQAGGKLRDETIRKLRCCFGEGCDIFIMYGQTEASARLSYLDPTLVEVKMGSIGKGIPGVLLDVVDDKGVSTAPNEVGEIIASGENVMLGYLGAPEQTASTIRDGWLYTGDMARRDEDGYIYVVNRKSDFIKSGAYRISPLEIEEVLAQLPWVDDVAVVGVEDVFLGEAVVACICCDLALFDSDKLLAHCRLKLPSYKIPRQFIHMELIPRTASGKTKYNVLRKRFSLKSKVDVNKSNRQET